MGSNLALKLVEGSKQDRDRYITKTEILERVKGLSLLPNTELMTIRSVAEYYEVDIEAIRKISQRNREELKSNGMRFEKYNSIKGLVKLDTLSSLRISPNGTTLFTRRAVLNVGMLLRDSKVAEQVRSYLLDTEREYKRGMLFQLTDDDKEFILKEMYYNLNKGMLIAESFRDIASKLGLNENQVKNKWYGYMPSKGKKLKELFDNKEFMTRLLEDEIKLDELLEIRLDSFIEDQERVNKQLLSNIELLSNGLNVAVDYIKNMDSNKVFNGLKQLYKEQWQVYSSVLRACLSIHNSDR